MIGLCTVLISSVNDDGVFKVISDNSILQASLEVLEGKEDVGAQVDIIRTPSSGLNRFTLTLGTILAS